MQAMIARTVGRLIRMFWSRELTTVVMTSAIAPIGWTTVSGACASAYTFSTIPMPISDRPKTQRGLPRSRIMPRELTLSPPLAARTALLWRCVPKARKKAAATAQQTATQGMLLRRARPWPSSGPG